MPAASAVVTPGHDVLIAAVKFRMEKTRGVSATVNVFTRWNVPKSVHLAAASRTVRAPVSSLSLDVVVRRGALWNGSNHPIRGPAQTPSSLTVRSLSLNVEETPPAQRNCAGPHWRLDVTGVVGGASYSVTLSRIGTAPPLLLRRAVPPRAQASVRTLYESNASSPGSMPSSLVVPQVAARAGAAAVKSRATATNTENAVRR
jgi:hypothetical protein